MSSIKVREIIYRVEDILQDSNIRWPRLELQRWLNEAYLSILLLRPDANAQSGTFTCVAGTRQILTSTPGGFPSALRLMDIVRNLTPASRKRVVRHVSRSILDDQRPDWHTESETINVQHFMFDPRLPKEFLVYPPAQAGTQLEVAYSSPIEPHTLTEAGLDPDTDTVEYMKLDDVYLAPVIDWILYRAYSKDAEYGANDARAQGHFQAFSQALTVKAQVDGAANPQTASTVT